VSLAVYMHGKFEVFSFNDSRDMEGVPQFKSTSRDLFTTPFDLILHLFEKYPVINLSVKFDADIFISDRYIAILLLR